MKKRFLTVLLVLLFSVCALFAQDWWMNQKITSYEVKGTAKIEKSDITSILYDYRGKSLTTELIAEIESKIYAVEGVDYIITSVSGKEGQLNLSVTVKELPTVSEIKFEGNTKIKKNTLESSLQTVKKDSFFDSSKKAVLEKAAGEIKKAYVDRGFSDVKVSYSYQDNKEKNTVSLVFTVEEGIQRRISSISYQGNNNVSDSILKKQISSSVSGLFNHGYLNMATVNADAEAIAKYYQTTGFIDVVIKDVKIEEVENNDKDYTSVAVTFVIDEGLKWYYGGMTVSGNSVFSDEEINALLTLEEGTVLNLEKVQNQYNAIEDLYMDQGYMFNGWNMSTERDDKDMTVTYFFDITEGPQAFIDEIWITGLEKTQEYVMRRELSIKEGDAFSKAKFVTSARNLYNTGLLSNLDYKTYSGTKENSVIVEFLLEEGSYQDISFGATFGGSTEGFPVSGFIQWADKNFRGRGQDMNINANLAPLSQSLSFSFGDDWFKDLRWANQLSLSLSRNVNKNKESTSGSNLLDYDLYALSLGYNTGYSFVWDPGTLSLSAGLSFSLKEAIITSGTDLIPKEELIQKYVEGPQFSNRLTYGASWDGRDRATNTTSGYIASLNGIYAGGILGGSSNYNRINLSASGYMKLAEIPVDEETRNLMFCLTSTASVMLPQYDFKTHTTSTDATSTEYPYIDGNTIARGHSAVNGLQFTFDNIAELSFPIVEDVVNFEAFASATGAKGKISEISNGLDWYLAFGFGGKLKVAGLPLGLYLVKDATYKPTEGWKWLNDEDPALGGFKVVLSVSQSLI